MEDLIYGKNTILEYLKSHKIEKLWISQKFSNQEILNLVKSQKNPYLFVDHKKLDSLCPNSNHQGIVAKVKSYEYWALDQMLNQVTKNNPRIIILDSINDPHNLGSIIRTAECLGVSAIIIPKNRSVQVNSTVIKVASGATNFLPIVQVTNLVKAVNELKEKHNFWVVAFDLAADSDFDQIHKDTPIAIVMGNESKGISQSLLAASDHIISIKMEGKTQSLNVSVATGIAINNLKER